MFFGLLVVLMLVLLGNGSVNRKREREREREKSSVMQKRILEMQACQSVPFYRGFGLIFMPHVSEPICRESDEQLHSFFLPSNAPLFPVCKASKKKKVLFHSLHFFSQRLVNSGKLVLTCQMIQQRRHRDCRETPNPIPPPYPVFQLFPLSPSIPSDLHRLSSSLYANT